MKTLNRTFGKTKHQQQGAVLIVSLMVLLMLTVLTLSSAQTILLQEKMTSSARDARLAFQVSESAAMDAQNYIESQNTIAWSEVGTGGFWQGDPSVTGGKFYYPGGSNNAKGIDNFFTDTDGDGLPDAFETNVRTATEAVDCGLAGTCTQTGSYFIVREGIKSFDLSGSGNVTAIDANYEQKGTNLLQACMYKIVSFGNGIRAENSSVVITRIAYDCI